MKILLSLILAAAAFVYYEPSILQYVPLPKSEAYESQQVGKHIEQCQKNAVAYVNSKVKDHLGLNVGEFKNLIENKNFQKSFCECHGEIVKYSNLIPSDYLPSPVRKKANRGIASHIESHLKTSDGQEQVQYCFYSAWTKAAFSY